MSMQLGFLSARSLLWLLPLLPLIGLLLAAERLRRERQALLGATITRATLFSGCCAVGALFMLVISLARPYCGYSEIKLPGATRDILAVVDISRSMLTEDMSTSRLEFAKRKLLDLSAQLSKESTDRLGIILFAGESYLFCPLTNDYRVVQRFTKAISTDLINVPGSELNRALKIAVESAQHVHAQHPQVILFTDGEDGGFEIASAVATVRSNKIPISIIGIGTPEGQPIEYAPGKYIQDERGDIVVSKLNEGVLRELATRANGTYRRATLGDEDLRDALLPALSLQSTPSPSEQVIRNYHEVGGSIVAVALVGLMILLALRVPEAIFVAMIICGAPSFLAICAAHAETKDESLSPSDTSPAPQSAYEAYRAYKSGDYRNAARAFQELSRQSPNDSRLLQAYGNSLYRLKKYDRASKAFEEAAMAATNTQHKFQSLYNKGNSLLLANKPKEALSAYDGALALKPDDTATRFNRELASKALKQQEKEQKQDNQNKNDQDKEDQQSPNKQQQTPRQEPKSQQEQGEKLEENDPSSQPEESPQPSESDAPNQQDTPVPSPTLESRSPGERSSPSEDTPTPSPTNSEGGEEEEPEATSQPMPTSKERARRESQSLSEREARAWLESLSDSPLLLRRVPPERHRRGGQTW